VKGRKPKATALRIIEGNKEHRPINTREPKPKKDHPKCPKILDFAAKKRWNSLVRELESMGILAHSDQGLIAAAANSYSRWHRAEEQLQILSKEGKYSEIIKTKSGNWIQNPLVGIANAARDACIRFELELGLSPTARTRIKLENPQPASRRERLLS
jgi:P27 family predicted phage terminase small subunit